MTYPDNVHICKRNHRNNNNGGDSYYNNNRSGYGGYGRFRNNNTNSHGMLALNNMLKAQKTQLSVAKDTANATYNGTNNFFEDSTKALLEATYGHNPQIPGSQARLEAAQH